MTTDKLVWEPVKVIEEEFDALNRDLMLPDGCFLTLELVRHGDWPKAIVRLRNQSKTLGSVVLNWCRDGFSVQATNGDSLGHEFAVHYLRERLPNS